MVLRRGFLLLLPLLSCFSHTYTIDEIERSVQPVIDQLAEHYNSSFQLGVTSAVGEARSSSGYDSIWTRSPLSPHAMIPSGSITKFWTMNSVMQFVQGGFLHLDDPAAPKINKVMRRLNSSSMESLWGTSGSQYHGSPLAVNESRLE